MWLRADPGAAGRAGPSRATHRPLLDDDPEGSLRRLLDRAGGALPEVADVVVDVDGPRRSTSSSTRCCGRVRGAMIRVAGARSASGPTTWSSGRGVRKLLPEVLPAGVRRVAVVTQAGIPVDVDAGVAQRRRSCSATARRPRRWPPSRSSAATSPGWASPGPTSWWRSAAGW